MRGRGVLAHSRRDGGGTETMTTIRLSERAAEFVDSVMAMQPKFAAFDCDGTLWAGDAGEGFFSWEFERGVVSAEVARREKARYAEYRAGKVSEDDMCAAMVTLHQGMTEVEVEKVAAQFFEENMVAQIFPEMRELVNRLQESGCEVWAVSSTNEWVIRAAMRHFGIPAERILAAAVAVEDGVISGRMVQLPSGEGKARAIRAVVRKDPDAAFGNSRWDADMLKIARHAFAVNPNPDLEKLAQQRGWPVYWPDSVRE
jgi:HAD superfamily hydrolase (TIGR01490 family)